MITQAIVKESGCSLDLKSAADHQGKARLQMIQDWVNDLNIRQFLVTKLRGKIVKVNVYSI